MSQGATDRTRSLPDLSTVQASLLAILRIAIGWHFLYEGIVKLLEPNWSSAGYLAESKWIFSGLFDWVLANPAVLNVVDALNIYGLILIGLGLFFGCFTLIASISGIILLLLYYVTNPPLIKISQGIGAEGNYLFIDKNLVELFALSVLAFSRQACIGDWTDSFFRENHQARQPGARRNRALSRPGKMSRSRNLIFIAGS